MKKFLSLALALIMVLGLVACGGGGSTTSGGTTSTPAGTTSTPAGNTSAGTTEPKVVKDTINLALEAPIATSDPMANTKNATMQTFQWAYESLIYADGDANIHPALATSWEVKNDGKDYVFQIRQGVKFHSGSTMTADDVVYSINRAKSMSYMKNYTTEIDNAEKTGEWEITIHLTEPHNGFLYNLYVLKVVEQAIVEKEGENFGKQASLAGTGPYMYKEYNPNALVVFEAFEDYWNKENVGNIKTINAHIITNASTRVTALQTGELDFIPVPSANWDQIQKSGKFETVLQEGNSTLCYIVAHHDASSPLADKRVRQAMKYAINQEAIIQVAAGGLGVKAEIMCNPTYIAGAQVDDVLAASFPYDVEKAKELLKEAGYPDGFTLAKPFLIPTTGDHEAVAQMLQNMWEQVGIKVRLEMADSTTASAQSKSGDYQSLYMTTSALTWDHSNQTRAIHSNNVKTTVAKYARANEAEGKELDTYLENAKHALTTEERDEWYLKADKFLDRMAVNVPLYHVGKAYAWDPALDCTIGTYYLYVQEWNWT